MHERLVRIMTREFPIAHAPLPYRLPAMREMLQYHRARAPDEGLSWLRAQIAAVVEESAIEITDRKSSKQ
jgi:hypothetical protein